MTRGRKTQRGRLVTRIADAVHSIETVPLPGTRFYSFLVARQIRPLYASIAEHIVSAGNYSKILDLGAGPGYVGIEIAMRDAKADIYGIDPSSFMIDIATANAKLASVDKSVHFQVGDPHILPFPGRFFDIVLSVNVMHHWREPFPVFESAYHVLINGGEFWVYDYRCDTGDEIWADIRKGLSFLMRTALQFGPMASSRAAYGREQLLEMASQTHFECLGLEDITLPLFGRDARVFNLLRLRKP